MIRPRLDLPAWLFGSIAVGALFGLPFVIAKANRIVPGVPVGLIDALGSGSLLRWWVLAVIGVAAVFTQRPWLRLVATGLLCTCLALALGHAAQLLTPAGNAVVRIAPGAGFWCAMASIALLGVDAAARLHLRALARLALLGVVMLVLWAALTSGYFDHVSVIREYAVNADRFAHEFSRHLSLALGSVLAAVSVGLPMGLACQGRPWLRQAVLSSLSLVQTIPSIALYGMLMAPLAALAVAVPTLAQWGIGGIGYAPAVVALFLYALLPVVANTVLGLASVDPAVVDAARGMGLTDGQILTRIRWPLALPTIVTGVRVVLVQNMGLAAIAALIGGGGLGAFIFQGIGQTAIDLVLLGALPTVALALAAGVVLDALVEWLDRRRPA